MEATYMPINRWMDKDMVCVCIHIYIHIYSLWKLLSHVQLFAVHGILQARLEWVAFPFSRESSQLRDQTQVSLIAGRFFTS